MGEIGERDQPAQAVRVERVAGERRRGEHEHADRGCGPAEPRDRDRRDRRGDADERDDRRGLRHPAESRRIGGGLVRDQAEAPAGDEDKPGRRPPARAAEPHSGQRGSTRDEHAGEEEQAEEDRLDRRPVPAARIDTGRGEPAPTANASTPETRWPSFETTRQRTL